MNQNDPKMQAYLQNQFNGTKPHLDQDSGLRASLKKLLAPINPFEVDQIQTPNRVVFSTFKNHRFYAPDPLPNPIRFSRFLPTHYDSLNDTTYAPMENFLDGQETSSLHRSYKLTPVTLPPVCERYLFFYKRCSMINGSNKCSQEEKDFLEICPNFALNKMRDIKLKNKQSQLIQMEEYKRSMEVSSYNQGRSMKDIDMTKRWEDGTASKLRPDTFWCDERYSNVNDKDIAEAKERVQLKRQEAGNKNINHLHHPAKIDMHYETYGVEKPLFQSN